MLSPKTLARNGVKIRKYRIYRSSGDRVRFIVFEVEKSNGSRFYTAIAPLRVTRVPWLDPPVAQLMKKDDMTKSKVQEAFDQIFTAIYQSIRAPLSIKIAVKNEGGRQELFLIYSITARGKTEEEVLSKIKKRRNALEATLVGKFPQIGLDELKVEDAKRFYNPEKCSYVAVGSGIPTRPTTGNVSKEQVETILRTLMHADSAEITINLTPIKPETIEAGIHEILEVFGTAGSNARGVRSTSFSISVPFSYISGFARSGEFTRSMLRNYGLAEAYTQGVSHAHGLTQQTTTSHGITHTVGQSIAESISHSQSASHALSHQLSETRGFTDGYTRGETLTLQETQAYTRHHSVARSIAENYSEADTASWMRQHSYSTALTHTVGESTGVSRQYSQGYGFTETQSIAEALSRTVQRGVTRSHSYTHSAGLTESLAESQTRTVGYGQQWGETIGNTVTTSRQTSIAQSIAETLTRMFQETMSRSLTHGTSQSYTHGVNYSEMISRMIQETMSRAVTNTESWSRSISNTVGRTETITNGQSIADYSQLATMNQSGTYMNYYSTGLNTGQSVKFGGILGLLDAIRALSNFNAVQRAASGPVMAPTADGYNVLQMMADAIDSGVGSAVASLLGSAAGEIAGRITSDIALFLAAMLLGGQMSSSVSGQVGLPFVSASASQSLSYSIMDGSYTHNMGFEESHYNIANPMIGMGLLEALRRYADIGIPGFHSVNYSLSRYVNPLNPNAPPQLITSTTSHAVATSQSTTTGQTFGGSKSVSVSSGLTRGLTTGFTRGIMDSWGITRSMSETMSRGFSSGVSHGYTFGKTVTETMGLSESLMRSLSKMFSTSQSFATGFTRTMGRTESIAESTGIASSLSEALGRTITSTHGIAESRQFTETVSFMKNLIEQLSRTVTETTSEAVGGSRTVTRGFMRGMTTTDGYTEGYSESVARSFQHASSHSESYSTGQKIGETFTRGEATTTGTTHSTTYSDAETITKALAIALMTQEASSTATQRSASSVTGVVAGEGIGFTTTATTSVGMVPSFGVSTSWQTINPEAIRIANLAAFLYSRYEKMRQEGGWLTFITATAETEEDLEKAMMALASGGGGPIEPINNVADVLYTERPTEPFRVYRIEDEKLAEMLKNYAVAGLTPVMERKGFALERYALATPLRTEEVTAISHPPRKDFPGIIHVENIPQVFNLTPPPLPKIRDPRTGKLVEVPSINVGFVVNTHTGRHTQNMVRIPISKITHAIFLGVTGYGKTNAVMHLVLQLIRNGVDVLVIDWKNTWRKFLNYVHDDERKKVKVFTLMDDTAPLKFNPLRPPILIDGEKRPMDPSRWKNFVKSMFAIAYSPFMRSTSIISSVIHSLYTNNKVFEKHGEPGFNQYPTMSELLRSLKSRIEAKRRNEGWASRLEMESIAGILDRLEEYAMPRNKLAEHYGNVRIGFPLEYLFAEKSPFFEEPGSIVIIEGGRVSDAHRQFLLGLIVGGIYEYYNELKKPRARPLVIVLEEAPRIIFPNLQGLDLGNVRITETPFETMFREGREYNLKLWVISQTVSALSPNIVANTPMRTVFRFSETQQQELQILIRILGLDPSWDHRPVTRYVERMEHGRAVFVSPYAPKSEFSWPYLIQFPYLGDAPIPTDEEIADHMRDTIARMWDIIRSINEEESEEDNEGRTEALKIIKDAVQEARKILADGKPVEAAKKLAGAVLTYLDTFGDDTVSTFAGYTRYEVLSALAGIPEPEKNLIRQLYDTKNSKRTVTIEEAEALIERVENLIKYMEENPGTSGNTGTPKREERSEKKEEKTDLNEMDFNETVSQIFRAVEKITGKKITGGEDFLDALSSAKDKIDSETAFNAIDCYRLKQLADSSVVELTGEDAEKCRETLRKLMDLIE